MLHTKFRGNRPIGSGEKDFLKGFYHILAWRPSWSCDQDITNKISMPLSKQAPHKSNLIDQVVSEKIFEIVTKF